MLDHFPFYLGMIVLIVLLIMLANKIRVAYPVLLVIAGLLISFIPGIPALKIEPELIFIIFLPPLLYEASWANSWKELWHWRRIITSFAFVVVFFTAISVAFVANYFIPGFSLALGFLLGGIVSPPDAVSAGAILRFVNVPKRMSSILEGESLLNDASSLIIFRFAFIAVATGQFIWHEAALSFVWMVLGGAGAGLLVGFIFLKAHKWLPTDVNMDTVLTLVTPYAMYIAAEEIHCSGVLAVVSGGLFLSYHRHKFLSGSSRLRGENVWQSLVFLLNGLVFLLIGLDLPEITEGLEQNGISISEATLYGVIITLVLIVGRTIAAFGAVIVTKLASYFITVADANPGYKAPFILGWTGMRGVVSLAAALSIPVTLDDGTPFPYRNLILYITFVVILLTLVVQGLTLPMIIEKLGLPHFDDHMEEEETKVLIREKLAAAALGCLEGKYKTEYEGSQVLQHLARRWGLYLEPGENRDIPDDIKHIYMNILEKQRITLLKLNEGDVRIDEDVVRMFIHQIDLEEEKLKG
ncbi:sodium:proton antiporter [Flavobacterium akiainvivens]|uniref:Sodium:proton antiporter n=1 Tax=Flavobacterium akiainvivens TaxID=1202724 RepID=A0A0M9VI06_9FLAO|nr:Na+/H+ antiporter [Flavobacterium akiainvivens]KOS06112.1 sodium:proton antiporter [Flavobacterium akiainvivens]SFQ55023.1 sodium/proton antiporter, CPA1 family [Flavobacterium akiainvivens]